jgi:hypothetical protein
MVSASFEHWESSFLRWALSNSFIDSNVQLARFSNVCRLWRSILTVIIVEDVTANLRSSPASVELGCENYGKSNQPQAGCCELLLLPSIVNRLLSEIDVEKTTVPFETVSCREYSRGDETFCLAWFPSEGIVENLVDLSQMQSENSHILIGSKIPQKSTMYPVVATEYKFEVRDRNVTGSEKSTSSSKVPHHSLKLGSPLNESMNSSSLSAICTEWRGYRSASEVLIQFGYSSAFIKDVLRTAIEFENPSTVLKSMYDEPYYTTTCAVRGATVARPEHYCLCFEDESSVSMGTDDFSFGYSPSVVRCMDNTISKDCCSFDDSDRAAVYIKQCHQSLDSQTKQILDIYVPRCVEVVSASLENNRQCVQFLNSSGSHAVCMATPPFKCGPTPEPITVFCVGVAIEDGCFMSSLNHPFEIGHIFPADNITECTERSSICLSTVAWNDSFLHSDVSSRDTTTWHSDSGDIAGDENGLSTRSSKCGCSFQRNISKAYQQEEDTVRAIHRGILGPGSWHCYTAVFDGNDSQIRIDGIQEPISHITEFGKSIELKEVSLGMPMLDGLTIGSDHCFGMSLCCGNGSDGEGEGAILELVVFSGRFKEEDLYVLERNLMAKHGIKSPNESYPSGPSSAKVPITSTSSPNWIWKDDTLQRQAHALMLGEEICTATALSQMSSVPLSYLARHRSVAWEKMNPVTREPNFITKIGQGMCHHVGSSSEF